MQPYYRESGEERRVKSLSVKVRFPRREAPDRAWQVVWKRTKRGMGRQEVERVACTAIQEPGTDSVVFAFAKRRPARDCAYGIVWRWPEAEPTPALVRAGGGAAAPSDIAEGRSWRPRLPARRRAPMPRPVTTTSDIRGRGITPESRRRPRADP
jgi:hypothetical protein